MHAKELDGGRMGRAFRGSGEEGGRCLFRHGTHGRSEIGKMIDPKS